MIRGLMTYRNRYIQTLIIMLAALLVGGSSVLRAQVVIKGSVYGGGNEADVMTTTTVNMSAGTVEGNIYGGGNLGDVGTINKENLRAYAWTGTDGNANNADNPYAATNTGVTHVNITGGTPNQNVFGGGKGYAETFWCEKGMVYSTDVRVSNVTLNGSVYGGGELGRVETNTKVTVGPESGTDATEIKGNVFGAGQGVETHGYSALVRGNTNVIVQNGAKVDQNVYGGGEIASVGKYNVDANGMPYSLANNGSGICQVSIPGSTQILGDIFGGGKGVKPKDAYLATETYTGTDKPKRMTLDGAGNNIWQEYENKTDYLIYLQTLALATQTEVTINPGTSGSTVISTKGNVYGGSENGLVQHNTVVTVQGNCQIGEGEGKGNIYGGGKGLENVEGAGLVGGDATVNINNGTMLGSVYGGGVLGATKGNVTVNINGGTVKQNVYGGGAYAHTNTSNWSQYVEVTELPANPKTAGLYEMSFGGIYTKTVDETAVENKTYYSKMDTPTWANSTQKSAVNKTRINLLGGTIEGDAYGGALGDGTHEPYVYGDILVDLNGTTTSGTTGEAKNTAERGCVVTHVFGCNNAKGTPKGDVLVHVYATQNSVAAHIANQAGDTGDTKPKVKGRYDVQAVYGGGNQAAYNPVDPVTNKTQVLIEGCDYTSIDYVYGGGNAAPVPSTDVTVNSCYEINTLFGGGNGSGGSNPGADVGIIDPTAYEANKSTGTYGPGTALVKLHGGEIHVVYGGSNEKGNIVGGATVNVSEEGTCTLNVGQIYGAGNNAEMDGGTDIVMGCMPAGVIEEIYAGARNADVAGDVKLTITSGTFGRVFGGNKHGGKLQGSITVNIEETGDCNQPIIIGELYGGGNLADYSVYGYDATTGAANETGSKLYADPKLNVHAFTSIGAIYGGGYRAKMVANPTVDINVVKGSHAATAYPAGTLANIPTQYKDGSVIKDGDPVNLDYPAHEANKIGAINNVFGGGNLAPIVGNATVNIGTETTTYFKTEPKHFRTDAETPLTPVAEGTNVGLYEATVEGAIIKGSVYGGGNEADITGNTQVNICAKYDTGTSEYRRVAPGTAGVTIDKDVFGGGKGVATDVTTALVTGNTTIVMYDGEVKQSVYGGGELSQVGGDATITVNGGTIGTENQGGETYGNIYGAGKGNTTNVRSGLIQGNTNINIGKVVDTEGAVVCTPTILHNIYGGGAHGSVGTFTYDASDNITNRTSGGTATITITGGTIGYDGHNNGMIFGSSRGDIDAPGTIYDKVAWVYDTHVIIGTANDATSGPRIWGSVYGSGENGHTYHDAEVTIKSGTIGDPTTYFENRGNVYGGGCGTDKYYSNSSGVENPHDGNGNKYNHIAGIVQGDARVIINGGSVANNVYGAGSMGKVGGSTFVTINTEGSIGVDGTHDDGNVYGAARGELNLDTDYDYSSVTNTTVTISKGTVKGNVFGGGKAGIVKGSVAVNVTGGHVINDVYGGGALAHTNMDNWVNSTLGTTYNTTLNLTGGVIGNVYGGGLGDADHEANVYGNVLVTVNGTAFTAEDDSYTAYWYKNGDQYVEKAEGGTVPKTGRVFGCNNIKGTPKGNVAVVVRRTKRYDAIRRQVVEGHEVNKYEIRGVYGGGNLANYDPVGGKQTSVDVYDCANTSIEKVYGGGNSADVPTTHVTIHGCFDIHYVFGGGNGADVIWRNNRWEENDGANVSGNANVVLKGGTISDAFIGSDTKGTVQNPTAEVTTEGGGECTLKLTNFYGSSKRADVYGDVNIKISACSNDNIENVYGGSYDAQIHGNITMTVTSGILKNVLGGNDRLGSIGGNITINIDEADDCKPIIIQNLYGGGFNAPYPGAGATKYNGGDKNSPDSYTSVTSGKITINVKSCTRIDNIYGGGLGANAVVTGDTEVNINMVKGSFANKALPTSWEDDISKSYTGQRPPNIDENDKINNDIGTIGNVFGGGDQGNVTGNATVNIGTVDQTSHLVLRHNGSDPVTDENGKYVYDEVNDMDVLGAHITGNVYGGGNVADVTGNTKVYICTADGTTSLSEGDSGVTIAGNVFGGGKGNALLFTCEKAMVGHDGDGYNLEKGNTEVVIGNGSVGGSVFGGGEIGRVENNTSVTVGLGDGGSVTKRPEIAENVFGAGQGIKTHGYSALVRGKSTVTIGGDAWVKGSVYGGGDMSSVGRFWVKGTPGATDAPSELPDGMPYRLKDTDAAHESGKCVVTIQGHAEIGPDNMKMPTFSGHVFGAGKGALPEYHSYTGTDIPERMQIGNSWDLFGSEAAYITFIETLGMSAETDVTIKDYAFIKGSVYGGSENGHVLNDTYVKIQGNSQIGNGDGVNARYSDWSASSLAECNHWVYGRDENSDGIKEYLPYDLYNLDGENKPKAASDGHTFYGNVFGGGSGYFPYRHSSADLDGADAWVKDATKSAEVCMPVDANGYSDGKWLRSAGSVGGNTRVDITGGHILTSVYGGNEQTDVGTYRNNSLTPDEGTGTCTINMTGGTLGVPRTLEQIANHPVTCYLFGAGKGDQRINFNTWTNVGNTKVNISGNARIYGSTFGGGEDGHVIGDAVTTIGTITVDNEVVTETGDGVRIGTWGTSYVDGNVFGGGRGFSGEALTAGSIGGNVTMTITGGTMMGSVYGGGRLASVGIGFTSPSDPSYGQLKDDGTTETPGTYGHITINISGGTIGTTTETGDAHPVGGNVFGGSMGRITLLDGSLNPLWPKQAVAKESTVTISGTTVIKNSVYGGSEYGIVRDMATVNIEGGTVNGSVYGGGYGSDDTTPTLITAGDYETGLHYVFTPMIWTGCVSGDTQVDMTGGEVKKNVYGGGEKASVGLINCSVTEDSNGDITIRDENNVEKKYKYTSVVKHTDLDNGFALSWPYEFTYIPANPKSDHIGGLTTVNITKGSIGGWVFGGSKGDVAYGATDDITEQRYTEAFCANVRETQVTIGGTGADDSPSIGQSVYGGAEDGHVYEDAHVTINKGLVAHSVFGSGKGDGTFTTTLWDTSNEGHPKNTTDQVKSWTAGKVYGNTYVTMNDGNVGWFIYGGGNMASVGKGNYSGGSDDYSTVGYGETLAGNLWTSDADGDYAWHFLNSGKTNVTILGGTVGSNTAGFDPTDGIPYGSIFGGSRGVAAKTITQSPRYKYGPDFYLGYVNKAAIHIGGTTESGAVTDDGPTIHGSVYGGGQDGHVRNSTEIWIYKGKIAGQTSDANGRTGHVFGAGSGIGKYTDGDNQYCNNASGSVTCTTLVDVKGGSIAGNVYGGGALASVGPPKIPPTRPDNELKEASGNHKSYSHNKVTIEGGTIGGSVYGASRGPGDAMFSGVKPPFTGVSTDNNATADKYNPTKYATSIWTEVNVRPHPTDASKNPVISGSVYGGGEMGQVKESTEVNLTGGSIAHDVYGGGKGTKGTNAIAADVGDNTTVELNKGVASSAEGCSLQRIFGCNDLNGTPKGHVSVHIYATQHRNKTAFPHIENKYAKYGNVTKYTTDNYSELNTFAAAVGMTPSEIEPFTTAIDATSTGTEQEQKDAIANYRDAISKKKYDVEAVYGGGNLALYEPTNLENELTSVVIDGCELTSIRQVYGGGNAASTPATSVLVNGTYEIEELFGGGNGKDSYQNPSDGLWYKNPGANVGYKDFTHKGNETGVDEAHAISQEDNDNAKTKEGRQDPDNGYVYGSGVATTTVYGGRIHYVYGGSNQRGNIREDALSVYQEVGDCELNIDETTGAGKNADTDGEATLTMDCVENVAQIFGGSTNADVYNDITLNITNGTFEKVFGGNNTSGAIYGSITVNIEESGCQPINIGELYAGGYLAPYSIYGYETNSDGSYQTDTNGKIVPKRTGADPQNNPRINIISASHIGDIYGGGYQAEVVGSPYINVNMKQGYILVKRKEKEAGKTYAYDEAGTGEFAGKQVVYVDGKYVNGSTATDLAHSYNISQLTQIPGAGNENNFMSPLPLGDIGNIYGGGNEADITGNTHIEIGTGTWITSWNDDGTPVYSNTEDNRKAAVITGIVYGGGDEGGVTGNTYITLANGSVAENVFGGGHLGTVGTFVASADHKDYSFTDEEGHPNGTDDTKNTGICNVTITGGRVGPETPTTDIGNVFGAGMGSDADYYCEEAMAYGTNVSITNGTVTGNVYGGGKIARLENNTIVTIGLEGDEDSTPEIKGDVFAAGKGVETHGYSALVRGNPSVTVQGKAKVRGSVYGGGEIASVARYKLENGSPVAVEDANSGNCTVIVRDYAEIGPETGMQMKKFDGSNNPLPPDDKGHVFGAGKGVLPKVYSYSDNDHRPKRMLAAGTSISSGSTSEPSGENNIWEYFGNDADYHAFIETLGLSSMADVTIGGHAFVKGSVYGGSENGIVQYDTHVTIEGDCQIGNGDGVNRRYTADEWAQGKLILQTGDPESVTTLAASHTASLPECAHWDYVKTDGAPYDPYATSNGTYSYTGDYENIKLKDRRESTDGGKLTATDGHTYYGNVYGGGSGVVPYAPGLWHRAAGIVRRNTLVDITGGHILTSVYGGNEHTDVGIYTNDSYGEPTIPVSGGKCTVNMSGGTLGVPRTLAQIAAHPVTCYLFGAGKGDQRIFFNTWTNIREAEVNITGDARIYGSVFGGGEDGHVIEDVKLDIKTGNDVTVGTKTYRYPYIGTTGTSYVDGNIFGAGRGYSGEALTAGSIGGNVEVNISDGTMLGSVYGGGRLASVGIGFNAVSNSNYGQFTEDVADDPATSEVDETKTHGHVTVNITGGTIGNETELLSDVNNKHTKGGNVFGGSMGRLELLDGTTPNPMWPQLGQVKTATVNISGTAVIKSNVYGGGELGTVRDKTYVTIGGKRNADGSITALNGGTVNRDVYGGGYGSKITADNYKAIVDAAGENNTTISFGYTPMQWAGCVGKEANVNIYGGRVKKSVYGGGEMASVGIINYMVTKGAASVADNEVEFSHTTGGTPTYTKYLNIVKHADESNSFALSWPYEFSYIPTYEGKTNVTIKGGRIGLTKAEDDANPFTANDKDNGDVYGAGKGIAGDYKDYLFCANVGSAEVNIDYTSDATTLDPTTYMNGGDCIAGAVYGGAENGHVMGDTKVTLTNGLIGHALYGGGSGKSKFSGSLLKLGASPQSTADADHYSLDIYSTTAGKVFGNTSVEMSGGYVVRNIFGGGTMGSVGKGNYAGGTDDYNTAGYGETLNDKLWTSSYNPNESNSVKDNAWHFLNSGKCSVKITGGTVGYIDASNSSNSIKDNLPYGNVFGGCRGEAAPNIMESPNYRYCPEFFLGYANETEVIIGDETKIDDENYTGPTIYGSVYGGGQDGHVRRDTHVIINKGEIGKPYGTNVLKDKDGNYITDLDDDQWLHRGNVYGAGSGISKYTSTLQYVDSYPESDKIPETDYSTSAGSVTRFTTVDIKGGTIHRNVYGGGSFASVGPPAIPPTRTDLADKKDDTTTHDGKTGWQSQCTVNISGTIGTPTDYQAHYGGEVYGASRGLSSDNTQFATSVWTKVHIKKGADVQGNVFGGGDAGMVKKDSEVIIGEKKP